VTRAALLVAVEAVALTALGVGYAVAGVLGRPEDRLATVLAGALAVVVGLALLPVARALGRERAWARSPVVTLNLFGLPVGYGLAQGRVWVAAAVVLGLSVAVLLLLASPSARLAFRERD
jgi:heme A synthase